MKKLPFVVCTVVCTIALCFAQEAPSSGEEATQKQDDFKIFAGKVEMATPASFSEKTPARLTVIDEDGQRVNFVVDPHATIISKTGEAITTSKIKKDNYVRIEYIVAPKNKRVAKSIKVVE
jgi:hypothetical protein